MTATAEVPRLPRQVDGVTSPGTRSPRWWRSPLAARAALATAFLAILVATVNISAEWAHVVASLAAFAAAVTLIAAAVVAWERVVIAAQAAGLVERTHRLPAELRTCRRGPAV